MARPWEKQAFGPQFRGLLDRWQTIVGDVLYARTARNVDFFGGVMGKRGGTQLVTGYGTYTRTLGGASTTVQCVNVGQGGVAGGFEVGQTVSFQDPNSATIVTRTITAVNRTLQTLTVNTAIGVGNGTWVSIMRPIPGAPAIRGLFPATFRDSVTKLIAAAGGQWWNIRADATPTVIVEDYGDFVIDLWVDASTPAIAFSAAPSTIRALGGFTVGDRISIAGAGPAGVALIATITELTFVYASGQPAIKITPAASVQPTPTTATLMLQSPDPTVDQFGVMFANVLHLSSAHFGETFYPPRKYEEGPNRIYRHGILGPGAGITIAPGYGVGEVLVGSTSADPSGAGPYPTGDNGPVAGTYKWRFTYFNSRTGQESLASRIPPVLTTIGAGLNQTVSVFPSIDPQVDFIDLYRTAPGGGADYYFVARIANTPNTQAWIPYLDTLRYNLGNTLMREGLDAPAPNATEQFIPWPHANRLIALVQRSAGYPGYLLPSDQPDLTFGALKGESFPSTNIILVNHDDGDVYVTAAALFDSVVVFKRRSVWRILGILPNYSIEPVHFTAGGTSVGAIAPKLVVQDHDELLFAHVDGYYRLTRFPGIQTGFQSERVSLPVDNYFGNVASGDIGRGHAHFYRPARQIRAFPDFNAAIVLSVDGTIQGESMGWALWDFLQDQIGTPARITASTMMPSTSGVTVDFDLTAAVLTPDAVSLLGTETGHVLQADMGTADQGGCQFFVDYETVDFAPAGAGVAARGRAMDLQVGAYRRGLWASGSPQLTMLNVQFITDQLVSPGYIEVPVNVDGAPALFGGGVSPFHILGDETLPIVRAGVLVITPGQWHRLRFIERAVDSMWRCYGWAYWVQPITTTQITRAFRQSTLEHLT